MIDIQAPGVETEGTEPVKFHSYLSVKNHR